MSSIWPCQPSTAFCGLSGNVVQYVGHKHFMSKKTERNFSLSTAVRTAPSPSSLWASLAKRRIRWGTRWRRPSQSFLVSDPLPYPPQCHTWNNYPWHEGVCRPKSRRPGCTGPKMLSPVRQAPPLRSPSLGVPRHFTQTSRKEKNKVFVGYCS